MWELLRRSNCRNRRRFELIPTGCFGGSRLSTINTTISNNRIGHFADSQFPIDSGTTCKIKSRFLKLIIRWHTRHGWSKRSIISMQSDGSTVPKISGLLPSYSCLNVLGRANSTTPIKKCILNSSEGFSNRDIASASE